MGEINFENLLRNSSDPYLAGRIGRALTGNIDKTACFYHVITKSNDGGTVFYSDTAEYRHSLLCRLCEERGITILFSVTMPNHTHDLFLTPSWDLLSEVFRILNMNVAKYIRKGNPKRFKQGFRILRRYPTYVAIRDVVTLFYVGKYIFDNPAYLLQEKKFIPHSCFWMFEKGHFSAPYDDGIYQKLFALTPQELFGIYSSKTKEEVLAYAKERFRSWTRAMTEAVFYKPQSRAESPKPRSIAHVRRKHAEVKRSAPRR